ncbi:MAG: cation:proton antiporter [Acidobacteriaceae bacterium]
MPLYINDLASLFILATALSVVAKLLRQPLILAYLATGALVAWLGYSEIAGKDIFQTFGDLGIMFLLFLVGLEINYTSLRLVGKISLIIGILQIFVTTVAGYFLARLLGFASLPSLYLGLALTLASTIIVVKYLSDKRDLNSLYGKISIGLLLVQDLAAILILVVLSGIKSSGSVSPMDIFLTLAKALILFGVTIWLGRKILPHLFDEIAQSQEMMFLTSTAWLFLIALIVKQFGFSVEIAGILAGLSLANSSENFQIANKIRPLRDFFIIIFFIILGSAFVNVNFSGLATPIIVLSLFVLIGNPLIMLVIMGLLGFKKRTSFLAGLTVSQISEFSLIMAALGKEIGHIDSTVVGVITAVGIISITVSSYLIHYSNHLFKYLEHILSVFEKKISSDLKLPLRPKKSIVLIGFHRTGQSLAHNLPVEDLMVVDFDPEMTKKLEKLGYDYIFGDIADEEVFSQITTTKTKLVISTSPDLEDNLMLISYLNKLKRRPALVVRAETERDALLFYDAGADYVLVPHLSSGHHLGKLLAGYPSIKQLDKLKNHDLKLIKRDLSD